MSIFKQTGQKVSTQVNALPSPKFTKGQKVIYRVAVDSDIHDIRCQVLDTIYSAKNGYSYQLSGLKDFFSSDIKPEASIRANINK